jgi:hypothetical protein
MRAIQAETHIRMRHRPIEGDVVLRHVRWQRNRAARKQEQENQAHRAKERRCKRIRPGATGACPRACGRCSFTTDIGSGSLIFPGHLVQPGLECLEEER